MIKSRGIKPKLVGFLANEDPAAIKYAESISKTCEETGITFELRKCKDEELGDQIVLANDDNTIILYKNLRFNFINIFKICI